MAGEELNDTPFCVPSREWLDIEVPDFPPLEELQEREWTRAETVELLEFYDDGFSIYECEEEFDIELRQMVLRLVRLVFGAEGYLDDEDAAPKSGEAYSADDQRLMQSMYAHGCPLAEIAQALGRTPLGAGWKMLSLRIPVVSGELRREYFSP